MVGTPRYWRTARRTGSSTSELALVTALCGVMLTQAIAAYRSFWTLTGSPKLLKHPSLISLATTTGCTAEQAVYRYAQLSGITPLCGTTDETHMKEALAVETVSIAKDNKELEVLSKFTGV
jgi:diketogulonate reductase-like aldo/keto reductase